MKTFFLTITIVLFSISAVSQEKKTETQIIEKAVLNYIENFFENNFEKMNESLHPRLAKRGLNQDGLTMSEDFPPEKLKELMTTKPKFLKEYQKNTVENISVFGNMASANLKTGYPNVQWMEFIHLVKQEGKWKIINIFWDFKD